jgi:hypothetical protein
VPEVHHAFRGYVSVAAADGPVQPGARAVRVAQAFAQK